MKKTLLVSALALAVGLAFVPALVPAQADAATIYLQQSSKYYFKDGGKWQLSYSHETAYNKKNLSTKDVSKNYDNGKLTSTSKAKYTYDSKGRMKTLKTYEGSKLVSQNKYTYKGSKITIKCYQGKKYTGKRIEKRTSKKYSYTFYDTKGKKTESGYTTYDKKGNMKVSKGYVDGKISYYSKNTIKKGKVVKSVDKNYAQGKLSFTYKATYSYKGKYTTEKRYGDDGGLSEVQKYYYDKAGYRVEVWSKGYYEGKMTNKTTYKAKKYKSGKLKGVVKQITTYNDGKATNKTVMKYKAVKAK